jgi:hypothetical protein
VKVAGVKLPTGHTRFSRAVLERAIKSALAEHGFRDDEPMWDDSLDEAVDSIDLSQNIWVMIATSVPAAVAKRPPSSHKPSLFRKLAPSTSLPSVYKPSTATTSNRVDAADSVISCKSKEQDLQGQVSQSPSKQRSTGESLSSNVLQKSRTWKMHSQDTVHRKKGSQGC